MMLSIDEQDTAEYSLRIAQSVLDSTLQKSLTQVMALRVLLADESSTIKKVFQLALQDYAVEVQSVNVGVDVVPVAKKFKPDIVFADVLLQKRSGYDVSADIKKENELTETPVVLLWSAFLQMDDDKFQVSRANAKLEKPFDVKTLRGLIMELVPKTKSQELSQYLHFPKMPDILESAPKPEPKAEITPEASAGESSQSPQPQKTFNPDDLAVGDEKGWNMESFEPIKEFVNNENEEFAEVPLPQIEPTPVTEPSAEQLIGEEEADAGQGQWVSKDLSRFETDLTPESDEMDLPVEYVSSGENLTAPDAVPPNLDNVVEPNPAGSFQVEEPQFDVSDEEATAVRTGSSLSREEIEQIVREEARTVIETAVWQVVPELAAQVIEKELKRLLDERDQ